MTLYERIRGFQRRYLAYAPALLIAAAPAMDSEGGARGCGSLLSQSEAPDMTGTWDVTYADDLAVEISIGGAVYTAELGVEGGVIEIDHEGQPLTFELDCTREDVVCPGEAWPPEFESIHKDARFPHQVTITLPGQECDGALMAPAPDECGENTNNPDCQDVCDGEVLVGPQDRLGSISEDGAAFDVLLGAGVASNGVNCALLAVSVARAELVSEGGPNDANGWTATEMTNGEVELGYAGGCLWADDANGDEELEALVLSATLSFTTTFTAAKRE